jgi:hypothetical protein
MEQILTKGYIYTSLSRKKGKKRAYTQIPEVTWPKVRILISPLPFEFTHQ